MPITQRIRPISALLLLFLTISAAGCTLFPNRSTPRPTPTGQAPVGGLPTLNLTPQPSPTPSGPPTYTDPSLGVSFTYPPGWTVVAGGRVEGPDGYAWLETRPTGGAGPGAVCQGEANRGRPAQYGAYPEIRDLLNQNQPACLIRSSEDQPAGRKGESLYLLWYPPSVKANTLLALHADRAHIAEIGRSLVFNPPPAAAPVSRCDFNPPQPAHQTLRQNGLRIDEYPLALAKDCSPHQEPEAFNERTKSGKPAERAEELFNRRWSSAFLGPLNARLEPFGFRVGVYRGASGNLLLRIFQNGNVARANISWMGDLSLSADRKDFILPLVDSYDATTFLLRPEGVLPIEEWDLLLYDHVFPVLVGQDEIRLAYENTRYPRTGSAPALLEVRKNGARIDTISVSGSNPARGPVRGLWAWDNHWLLELPGLFIQDGQILNDTLGYSEMFQFHFIKGRQFYFFRKDNLLHMSYNGETLPTQYEQVIHEPQWTMAVLLSMKVYTNGLVFYAQRGGVWYYVVIEAE